MLIGVTIGLVADTCAAFFTRCVPEELASICLNRPFVVDLGCGMPRVLFKYLPSSRATVLLNGVIRFTQVGALNDPFESRPSVQAEHLVPTLIEEYTRRLDELAGEWNNGQLTEEERAELNKAKLELGAYIRRRTAPYRLGQDAMRMVGAKLGVLSLSKTRRSLLLWAHYAAGHTGFVIGLDEENEFFSEVDEAGQPSKPHDVLYRKIRHSAAHGIPTEEDYQALLCQKSPDWQYEEEVRIFRVLTEETRSSVRDEQGFPVHLLGFPKAAVKQAIFGANSNYALQSELRRYLKLHKIDARVYRARIKNDSFEIEFDEVGVQHFRKEDLRPVSYSIVGIEYMLAHEMLSVLEPKFEERVDQYFSCGIPMPSAGAILDRRAFKDKIILLGSRFFLAVNNDAGWI